MGDRRSGMIFISSACIKRSNIGEVITLLGKQGIKNIELSGGTDYYEGIESDLKELKREYDLIYSCHAYFPPPREPFVVNLASCNDKIYRQSIEHYENCVKMLKHIDCGILSVHAGFMIEFGADKIGKKLSNSIVYNKSNAYDRFCSAYEYIAKQCSDNGIDLFLENNVLSSENYEEFSHHNYMMMTDYNSIMEMKKQLDFNLLLDLGHLHVSARTLGMDFQDECTKLREYVGWLHLSENNGVCDEHRPLVAESEILREFRKLYIPGINVTLETVGSINEVLQSMDLVQMK